MPNARRSPESGAIGSGLGDAQIHLVDVPAGEDSIRPTGPHECFGVEDIDAAIRELDARGIAYKRGSQGSVVQIWFVDPAGYTIEIQQDPDRGP